MIAQHKYLIQFYLILCWICCYIPLTMAQQTLTTNQSSTSPTPLNWEVINGKQKIASNHLIANQNGYLEYNHVFNEISLYFGFYKDMIPHQEQGLLYGAFIKEGQLYTVIDGQVSGYFGQIIAHKARIRLERKANLIMFYLNGTLLEKFETDPTLLLYPYLYDSNGSLTKYLEFYIEQVEVKSDLDWVMIEGAQKIAANKLRRGENGTMSYKYPGGNVYLAWYCSMNPDLMRGAIFGIYYSEAKKALYFYEKGKYKGYVSLKIVEGDIIRLQRLASNMYVFLNKKEIKKMKTDGNAGIHPYIYDFTGTQFTNISVSFVSKGGFSPDDDGVPAVYTAEMLLNCPSAPSCDVGKNWVQTQLFDGEGDSRCHLIGETRNYFDDLGRSVQNQSMDFIGTGPDDISGHAWISETIYDELGRVGISTLAAPYTYEIDNQACNYISYRSNFFQNANGDHYDFTDFNNNFATEANNTHGSLGWWYSTNNDEEDWQATTNYPFSHTEYSTLTGAARRTTIPGDAYQMGNDNNAFNYSFSMIAGDNELDYIFRSQHPLWLISADEGISSPNSHYVKTISVDADGKQVVSFADRDGNQVATCLVGPANSQLNAANKQALANITFNVLSGQYRDFHVTNANSVVISNETTNYELYNLKTDQLLTNGLNDIEDYGFYRIINNDEATTLTFTQDLFYHNFSIYIYDHKGQVVATVAPKDVVYGTGEVPHAAYSRYYYNSIGELQWEETPDAGRTNYFYSTDGKLRFSQNAKQLISNRFSYTKYDIRGRVIEVGLCASLPSGGLSTQVDNNNYPTAGRSQITYTLYDTPDSDFTPTGSRQQTFMMGKISKSWNNAANTWYSYDEEGRITWIAQEIIETGQTKYTDYSYDLLGNVTDVSYQENQSDEFNHTYTYDIQNRLTSVSTNRGANTITIEQAIYEYYEGSSAMKKYDIAPSNTLGVLDERHYVYTLQGQLKAINPLDLEAATPNTTFSMALDYYKNDYTGANNNTLNVNNLYDYSADGNLYNKALPIYSGQIAAQRWKTKDSSLGGSNEDLAYTYRYDHRNQLKSAFHGNITSGAYHAMTKHQERFFYNDDNANLFCIVRTDNLGNYIDNTSYFYENGNNQLKYIRDYSNVAAGIKDQGAYESSGNYTYNAIGQLTQDEIENRKIEYDVYGKIIHIRDLANTLKVSYIYDANGYRIVRKGYNATETLVSRTYYMRDINGNIQSIYEYDDSDAFIQTEIPLYGAERLGLAQPSNNGFFYDYELKDHLGNVRATIRGDGAGRVVLSGYTDYFPSGLPIPDRDANADYRFGYQGEFAEKEAATGWASFELRSYDPAIGRWMTIDPYGQYWSPYLAMGNDWVNLVDPDGGHTDDWFQNAEGHTIWIDSNASSYTDSGGEVYNNIGAWYWSHEGSNSYLYHQNSIEFSFIQDALTVGSNKVMTSETIGQSILAGLNPFNDRSFDREILMGGGNYNVNYQGILGARNQTVNFTTENSPLTWLMGGSGIKVLGSGLKFFGGGVMVSGMTTISKRNKIVKYIGRKFPSQRVFILGKSSQRMLLSTYIARLVGIRGHIGRSAPTFLGLFGAKRAQTYHSFFGRNAIPIGGGTIGLGFLIDKFAK